ncbi:MAG TPA: F0F1 ATP synthase subunit B' [Stellaceae bacterium]|nr:F0F1 ATP synthase subunit B' [Stellaceae bacterium]
MPQLDASTYLSQLFWLAVTFVALYLVMRYLAVPRVGGAIAARRQRLEEDLDRASRMKAEAEAVIAAHEKVLASARAEAQATLKETADKLAAEAAARQRAVGESLAKEIEDAERQIAAEEERALTEIRGLAVDLARSIAEKLTGMPAGEKAAAGAVDRAIAERSRQ